MSAYTLTEENLKTMARQSVAMVGLTMMMMSVESKYKKENDSKEGEEKLEKLVDELVGIYKETAGKK